MKDVQTLVHMAVARRYDLQLKLDNSIVETDILVDCTLIEKDVKGVDDFSLWFYSPEVKDLIHVTPQDLADTPYPIVISDEQEEIDNAEDKMRNL